MKTKLINLFAAFFVLAGMMVFADQTPAPDSPAPVIVSGNGWTLYALQAPFKPALSMTATGANSVKIYWLSSATNFSLVLTTNSPALVKTTWVAADQAIQDDGNNKYIVVTPSPGVTYYKLEANK